MNSHLLRDLKELTRFSLQSTGAWRCPCLAPRQFGLRGRYSDIDHRMCRRAHIAHNVTAPGLVSTFVVPHSLPCSKQSIATTTARMVVVLRIDAQVFNLVVPNAGRKHDVGQN
jgi:hypothetical protein